MTTQIVNSISKKVQLLIVSAVIATSVAVAVPALSAGATSIDCKQYDRNGDGVVNLVDLAIVKQNNGSFLEVRNTISVMGTCPKA